jgi:hypothetical protein
MVYKKNGADLKVEATTDLPNVRITSERGPAGDRYQLTLTLTADKSQAGPLSGNLLIRTNDPDVPSLTVPLSGELLP